MMTTSNSNHQSAHHVEAVEQWKSDYQHAVAQELGVHPSILNESLNIGVMPWQFDDPGDVEYHDIQGRDAAVEGKAYAVEMREAIMRPGGPIQESAQLIFYRAYIDAAERHGLLDEINYYEHESRDPRMPDLSVSDYSFVPRQFADEDLLGDPADAATKTFHADHTDRLREMKEEAEAAASETNAYDTLEAAQAAAVAGIDWGVEEWVRETDPEPGETWDAMVTRNRESVIELVKTKVAAAWAGREKEKEPKAAVTKPAFGGNPFTSSWRPGSPDKPAETATPAQPVHGPSPF